jgi:hypothetical protein
VGQNISGTALATTTVAVAHKACYRVRFDWTDAGFGSTGSWTNETAYVVSIRGDAQATDWRHSPAAVGHGVSNKLFIIMENPLATAPFSGRRFSPTNPLGPLYAYLGDGLVDGVRCIVEAGYYNGATPEYTRQITGYVAGLTENYANKTVEFEIRDRGADSAGSQQSTVLYTNYTAKQYLQALAMLFDRDVLEVSDQEFDEGLFIIPFAALDSDDLWKEIHAVAESQCGQFFFDKDGDLHFRDGARLVRPHANSWDNPTVSQFTFSVDDFGACNPRYDVENVWNHIVVQYYPRYIAVQQVVHSSSEVCVVPPGGTVTAKAEFHYPVASLKTPEADTDYLAVTAGGTDITDDIDITMTSYAHNAKLEITNNNSDYAAYLVRLQLRGAPVISMHVNTYEVEDAASIDDHGRRTLPVSSPYIQSYRHAQMVGDYLLARLKDPVQVITLDGAPAVPWLEVGDRVTVVESDNLGINEAYFIARIEFSIEGGSYVMSVTLMRAADLFAAIDYFILGTSKYGTGTGHGHLFW